MYACFSDFTPVFLSCKLFELKSRRDELSFRKFKLPSNEVKIHKTDNLNLRLTFMTPVQVRRKDN